MVLVTPLAVAEAASIWTDKKDYSPLEPVKISGKGFAGKSCLLLEIVWPTDGKTILVMSTDENGGFTVVWKNEKVEGTYTVNAYYCGSDKSVATTTFTDTPFGGGQSTQSQNNIKYTLEGLRLSPSVEMTTGSLQGWNEDDWIPFRLTIEGDPGSSVSAAIALEYTKSGKYGIDGFASCFGDTYPPKPCGSGSTPSSGNLWEVLVERNPIKITSASFKNIAGAMYIVFEVPGPLTIPDDGTLEITWAAHLARGGSTNLICSSGSPLHPCTPTTIPSDQGAPSYPGASLDVRGGEPPTGDRTVSIKDVGSAVPTGPVISATKTVESVTWTRTITYDWSVEKSASPESLELELGESETVSYRITVTRTVASTEDEVFISGQICVTNTGGTATQGLAIIDRVKYGETVLESTTVDVSSNPVLDPLETGCYQYALSFTPVEGVTTYTNEAEVTITNGAGTTVTQSFELPKEPTTTVEIDEYATLEDKQECPGGLSCELLGEIPSTVYGSTTIEFDKKITNNGLCLYTVYVENTVTLTEGDSGETHTDDASVSVTGLCAILEVSKSVDEVVWERRTVYNWTITKETNVSFITVGISQRVPIKYIINAVRTVAGTEDVVTIRGKICVKNVGNTPTKDLEVIDTVLHDSTEVCSVKVDTSSNPILDPEEEVCYDYEVTFTPLTIDSNLITEYINRANAMVSNGFGDYAEKEFSLPDEPILTEVDESAEITDVQECPENFECTAINEPEWPLKVSEDIVIEFEKVIHNLRVCEIPDNEETDYILSNTVTLIESDTGEERTAAAEVKIDVGPCPTRTQGFWATHPEFTSYIWTTYVPDEIKGDVCGKNIDDDLGKLMGGFWSDISRLSDGKTRRTLLDQARMQLVQQLLAAILNRYLLESPELVVIGDESSIDQMISGANDACKGGDRALILSFVGVLDGYNKSGDGVQLPSGFTVGPADPKQASSIADKMFWDIF
ncbi:MAG: hypothetical protein QXG45_02375 [Nitrososphaerota archaeon]